MSVYYEEIMELWKAGKFFEAISYSCLWMAEGLFNQEKTENLKKNLPKFWEDALRLTEEQKGFLFLLFKTVIDVVDEKGVGS